MKPIRKSCLLLCVGSLLLTACAAPATGVETPPEPTRTDVPDGFTAVQSGFVSYVMPEDWGYDPDATGDLNRHLGAHEAAPDVAAAETVVYLDFPEPEETELREAIDFLWDEFPFSEGLDVSNIEPTEIPGASEAARVDYVYSEFNRPEFDYYTTADLAIRAPSGELAAIRVGAVLELVDDGTFAAIVNSLQVVEESSDND